MGCKLCNHNTRTKVEEDVMSGVLPKTTVALELGMEMNDVILHMERHLEIPHLKSDDEQKNEEVRIEQRKNLLEQVTDKRGALINNVAALQDKVDIFGKLETLKSRDVTAFVSLLKEVRQTVMDMAKLDEQVQQEINITMNNFYELKAVILNEVCPECKKQIIQSLIDVTPQKK